MADAVVALTSAGATAIAQAIGGTKLQITSAHFGSDLINSYSQEQLEALTEVVSNGAASAVYKSDSSVISYLYPAAGEIQLRVNLGTSIGDFTIGNWGLVDSTGTLLFIIGLAATEFKSQTNATQAGDNRVYVLNIPLTSNLTDSVDFSILNVDAAALPEVTTETNLPSVDTSAYPVFHIQDYDSSGAPCLASRANEEWYYYLPLDSLLARNNTWTGTNTYTKAITAESDLYVNGAIYTNTISASGGSLNLTGGLTQTSESIYVNSNQLLARGWDGSTTDHVVKTIGVGWGDSLIPFVEYYNTAGTSSGNTTLLQLATLTDLDNLLTSNNVWTGTNTFNQAITAASDLDCKGIVYTNTIDTYSGTLDINSNVLISGVLNTENQYTIMNRSRAMNGTTTSGGYCWGNGLTVYGYGEMSAGFTISDVNADGGDYRSGINLTGNDYAGAVHQWYFHWDDYLYDGNGNKFLKAADVTPYFSAAANSSNASVTNIQGCNWTTTATNSYLQVTANNIALALPTVSYVANSITAYAQPKGNYIVSNNVNVKCFCWNVMAQSGDTITFPEEFTDVDSIVINLTSLDTSRGAWLTYDNVTTQNFVVHGRYMSHGNLDQMPTTQVSVIVYGW